MEKPTTELPLVRGKLAKPLRVVTYGPEGIGKSSFAASFPAPVFLDTEGGTNHLDVVRFPQPRTWADVTAAVDRLSSVEHPYKTLVIDTADWAEKLLTEEICRKGHKEGIEDFGYGKGYTYLAEEFARFLQSLERLRGRGMHVVFVAHSTIRKFEQPDAAGAYDRYELKLSKQTAPLLKEWCDLLLFVNYFTKVTEAEGGKKRAIGGRERLLFTTHTAAFDAKNRHGLDDKLPFSFESIAHAFGSAEAAREAAPTASAEAKPSEKAKPAAAEAKAPTKAATTAAASTAGPAKVLPVQLENIQTLWAKLGYGQAEMTKLFKWLDAEALGGAEDWNDLTQEQAAQAIGFLSKKASEKGRAA